MMKKLLAVIMTLGLFLGATAPVMADTTNQVQVKRLWGQDRYETATKIADELASQLNISFSSGQQFQAVVLASGNNWPDAIAGAPLARQYNAPILLLNTTPADSQTTWNYLNAHVSKNAKVFILGGTGVVPTTFTDYLVTLGYVRANVEQLGGADRNETSLLIAKKLNNKMGMAYLVSDSNFYDALSIASSAANYQSPILLTSISNGLTTAQRAFCDTFKIYNGNSPLVTVGELGSSIAQIYPNAALNIVSGNNRYDTNNKLERWHARDTSIFLATGLDYPDALAGAVLAGTLYWGGFIVLTDSHVLQPETNTELNDLAYFEHNPERWPNASDRFYPTLYVLGGAGAVSDEVVNQAQQILNSNGSMKQ